MKRILDLFIFKDKIKTEIKEVSGKFIDEKDFYVIAEKMSHGANCNAYSFIEKDKLRINKGKLKKLGVKGKIIGRLTRGRNIKWKGRHVKAKDVTYKQKGKKITIIMDTRINNKAITLAKDSDLLIMESCYMEDNRDLAKRYGHLTAEQAGEIAKKSKSKKLIISHISQRYSKDEKKVLNEAKRVFKNVQLAEDLDEIEV